jgi:hypothetical protein
VIASAENFFQEVCDTNGSDTTRENKQPFNGLKRMLSFSGSSFCVVIALIVMCLHYN